MNKKEMNQLGVDDLNKEVQSLSKQLFELRLKSSAGQVSDHSQFKKLRKGIAQALTFVRQKKAL